MEENSNWLKSETTGSLTRRLNDLLTEFERDDDDMSSEFSIKEEMVEEAMQELHKEIISPSACTEPTTWPASFPSPPSSSLSTSPFADSEGKSESCGASVSESASTVMAGIEFLGLPLRMGSPENGFCGGVVEGGGCNYYGVEVGESLDGCDGGESDDEWLGRLLRWDPPLLDDQS
ncbi:hypothetical protein SLA2020_274210 [Shorea laevis]|jgi:hypothetical protein